MPDFYKIVDDISKFKVAKHREYEKKVLVEKYINNGKFKDKKFLYPDSSYIHWQMNQSRHGFPQNGNIGQIKIGWWENVTKNEYVNKLPTNASELCEMYQNSGIEIIILDKIDSSYSCLNGKNSKFLLDVKYKLENGQNIYFFKNSN